MNIPAKLDGDWWFLTEHEPLDPESTVWTFAGETVVDSRHADAPGRHYMEGDALTITFPSWSSGQSALVAKVVPSALPVDPNYMAGNFKLKVSGYEVGDFFTLLRDGPWLDDLKRERVGERASEAVDAGNYSASLQTGIVPSPLQAGQVSSVSNKPVPAH